MRSMFRRACRPFRPYFVPTILWRYVCASMGGGVRVMRAAKAGREFLLPDPNFLAHNKIPDM